MANFRENCLIIQVNSSIRCPRIPPIKNSQQHAGEGASSSSLPCKQQQVRNQKEKEGKQEKRWQFIPWSDAWIAWYSDTCIRETTYSARCHGLPLPFTSTIFSSMSVKDQQQYFALRCIDRMFHNYLCNYLAFQRTHDNSLNSCIRRAESLFQQYWTLLCQIIIPYIWRKLLETAPSFKMLPD